MKIISEIFTLAAAALIVAGGCASQTDVTKAEKLSPPAVPAREEIRDRPEPSPREETKSKTGYVIGPDDLLQVSVWRHDDAEAKVTVDPDGNISLPIIGEVKAEGSSPRELERCIAGRLSQYYHDPVVTVTVTEYNNRRVYVLGEVSTPGIKILGGRSRLLDLLASSGNFSSAANLRRCTIVRGKGMMILVDLHELLFNGNMNLNIEIQPNDLIYIPGEESKQVYVLGAVEIPGIYSLTGDRTVVEAVMAAGGPTEDAALTLTKIFRGNRQNPQEIPLDLEDVLKNGKLGKNVELTAGDIVYVPNRFMATVNYYIRQVLPALQTIVLTDQASSALDIK